MAETDRGEFEPGFGPTDIGALRAPLRIRSGWFLLLPACLAAMRRSIDAELDERRGFQWLAVAFGTGALIYFGLPREPVAAAVAAAAGLAAAAAATAYHTGRRHRLLVLLAVLLLGLAAAKARVEMLDGPSPGGRSVVTLTGRVIALEERTGRRPRMVLDRIEAAGTAEGPLPRSVRVSLRPGAELPPLGTRIEARLLLMPVPGPSVPGGYDPRRAAFFDGIGASGFALGDWRGAGEAGWPGPRLLVAEIRRRAVDRILGIAPGEAGAVAAALLVGERGGLSDATKESLQRSGLAHIISISGLHMMLVAGTAFFLVRAFLALSPALALGRPIRGWAAVAALVVATAYLAISGGSVATVRAYVMAAIIFLAVIAGRPALSMRNIALAAFVVIALEPESVLEPGFQMSFAAVVALIAGWEAWRDRETDLAGDPLFPGHGLLRQAWRGVSGIALTTIIASLATAPYAAYHFERVTSYALVANMLAMPVVSTLVMPVGLVALVLMPFGLDAAPLALMTAGIRIVLGVSDWVASLPGASFGAPPVSALPLGLVTFGFLWLCLWRLRWRLLGIPVVALGLALVPLMGARPDIVVSAEGAVAVRDGTGVLRIAGARAGSFTAGQFLEGESAPPDPSELARGTACDAAACLLPAGQGRLVSRVTAPAAFAEDCARADVVVTPLAAPSFCAAAILIDAARLARSGAHAIRFAGEGGPAIVTTARGENPRPWQ
ncbi:ComEC/Rec2 family competence protein [Propylenella binzhouense]|nr:ComEC/Rec2 family competence protein [Propylenella binzhouense]